VNIVYFDLESQKLFHEVGGRDASKLLLACGVTWSTERNDFAVYWEKDAAALVAELKSADRVVGFNIIGFDYEVLRPYARNENFRAFRSTDMLRDIYQALTRFDRSSNPGNNQDRRRSSIRRLVPERRIGKGG
jgi:DEAD/DEAH box helicase domain-containing protein